MIQQRLRLLKEAGMVSGLFKQARSIHLLPAEKH